MSLFNDMTTKTFKRTKRNGYILSLDGGGTRGLIEIAILKEIENITGYKIKDLFDLIGGTSTGGIIAYFLGVKNYSVEECERIYLELAKNVFGSSILSKTKNLVSSSGMATYESSLLEEFSKKYMGDTLLSSPSSDQIKVFAVSIKETNPDKPFLFRTYPHLNSDYQGDNSVPVWEAALATSAAPTYFKKREIKGLGTFIDGGMGFNNPSEITWFESLKLWNNDIKLMLSLGTGDRGIPIASNPVAVASQLAQLVTSSDQVHQRIQQFIANYNTKVQYYRFNPPKLGSFDLAEINNLDTIRKETLRYLEVERDSFKKLCKDLIARFEYEFQ